MRLFDSLLQYLKPPKEEEDSQGAPTSSNQSSSGNGSQAGNSLAIALGNKDFHKVSELIAQQLKTEKAVKQALEQAVQQGNFAMIGWLTKNNSALFDATIESVGVPLKQWLADQGRDPVTCDKQPAMNLSAKALAQVSAIDVSWAKSQLSNTLILPPAPQSGANLMVTA